MSSGFLTPRHLAARSARTSLALLGAWQLAAMAEQDALSWLRQEKIKAAYHYARPPVVERLDRLQRVGINCMILKCPIERALPWLPEAAKRNIRVFLAFNFDVKALAKGIRCAVLSDGRREAYACPLDDRLWHDHLTPAMVERVSLSAAAATGAVAGLWIDFELYSTTTGQRYYTNACYCSECLDGFCAARQLEAPALEPNQRLQWLRERGLADAYQAYLQERIETLARELRNRIHSINPQFLLGFYPTPHNWSLVGVARGFSTEHVPILLWATDTYAGGGQDRIPDNWQAHYAQQRINARYIAGMLLRCYSARNLAANLYFASLKCDGYWLFTTYTLNRPEDQHTGDYYLAAGTPDDYWAAIKRGNDEIAKRTQVGAGYTTELDFAPEPVLYKPLHQPESRRRLSRLVAPPVTHRPASLPIVLLRGTNVLVVAAEIGKPVEVTLGYRPVREGREAISWRVTDLKANHIAEGAGEKGSEATVRIPSASAELLFVIASAGGSCWYPARTTVPLGLFAGARLHTMYGAERLYFSTPNDVNEVTIAAKGASLRETVRVDVLAPDGAERATAQSDGSRQDATVKLTVDTPGKQPWSLRISKAEEGILEDSTLTLPPPLPPVVSLIPEHVFGVTAE